MGITRVVVRNLSARLGVCRARDLRQTVTSAVYALPRTRDVTTSCRIVQRMFATEWSYPVVRQYPSSQAATPTIGNVDRLPRCRNTKGL